MTKIEFIKKWITSDEMLEDFNSLNESGDYKVKEDYLWKIYNSIDKENLNLDEIIRKIIQEYNITKSVSGDVLEEYPNILDKIKDDYNNKYRMMYFRLNRIRIK